MPTATVTTRKLKNKETGIDVNVSTHKEIPGLLKSTIEYHVYVVSSLQFFKSAKHKDTDVVQFMVSRKFSDFEDLYSKLCQKYPGTVLPSLPKKVLLNRNEHAIIEMRNGLDRFLKAVAQTQVLCTCSVVLEFLGVDAIRAGKYRKDIKADDQEKKNVSGMEKENEEDSAIATKQESSNAFGEEEEEDNDELFSDEQTQQTTDTDLFKGDDQMEYGTGSTKLFDDQDFGGGITTEETEDIFLPPGAKVDTSKQTQNADFEDNSDLLRIEDDLDKFLSVKVTNKGDESGEVTKTEDHPGKPALSPKPQIGSKPNVQPKPGLPSKPKMPQKPALQPKPNEKPETKETGLFSTDTTDLGSDDILKYIQDNTESADDVDLFG